MLLCVNDITLLNSSSNSCLLNGVKEVHLVDIDQHEVGHHCMPVQPSHMLLEN